MVGTSAPLLDAMLSAPVSESEEDILQHKLWVMIHRKNHMSHEIAKFILDNYVEKGKVAEKDTEIERLKEENYHMRRTFGSHPLFKESEAKITTLTEQVEMLREAAIWITEHCVEGCGHLDNLRKALSATGNAEERRGDGLDCQDKENN